MDVRIDQTRQHNIARQVQSIGGRPALTEAGGWTDVDDRPTAHGDGTVGEDPPVRIHRDDDAVLDEKIGVGAICHSAAAALAH